MVAPRVLSLLLLFDAGCETCGDPAEPLMYFKATIEAPATPDAYVHVSMFNGRHEYVDSTRGLVADLDGNTWSSEGVDLVEVACGDGCYPAREARVTIR